MYRTDRTYIIYIGYNTQWILEKVNQKMLGLQVPK